MIPAIATRRARKAARLQDMMRAEARARRRRLTRQMAAATAAGAALGYVFDPSMGRRRRTKARDIALGRVRRTGRIAGRLTRAARAEAYGVRQKVTHLREAPKELDDATIVDKIRSEVLGRVDVPTRINVDCCAGCVTLRGTVDRPEDIRRIEKKVCKVQGVRAVENLLHLPRTPAPNKQPVLH